MLSSNSNTIDITKGRQITVNYLGKEKPKRKRPVPCVPAALEEKVAGEEAAEELFVFPLEYPDWKYPDNYAARGRLYFNEISDDLDYEDHIVDESEKLKDGCTNLALYPDDYENPIVHFPSTPDPNERYEWQLNTIYDDDNNNNDNY
jgi:hypothetical protein